MSCLTCIACSSDRARICEARVSRALVSRAICALQTKTTQGNFLLLSDAQCANMRSACSTWNQWLAPSSPLSSHGFCRRVTTATYLFCRRVTPVIYLWRAHWSFALPATSSVTLNDLFYTFFTRLLPTCHQCNVFVATFIFLSIFQRTPTCRVGRTPRTASHKKKYPGCLRAARNTLRVCADCSSAVADGIPGRGYLALMRRMIPRAHARMGLALVRGKKNRGCLARVRGLFICGRGWNTWEGIPRAHAQNDTSRSRAEKNGSHIKLKNQPSTPSLPRCSSQRGVQNFALSEARKDQTQTRIGS